MLKVFATVSMAAMLAAPVTAQHVQQPLSSFSQAQKARQDLDFGAVCLLRREQDSVKHFLGLYPYSDDASRMSAYLAKNECIDGSAGPIELQFSPEIVRGVLYKALYDRDFANAASALAPSSPNYAAEAQGQPDSQEYVATRSFADCVARKSPAAARALVMADAESSAELAAVHDLQMDLDPCMTAGKVAPLNRARLAGLLAEALYRISDKQGG